MEQSNITTLQNEIAIKQQLIRNYSNKVAQNN